MITTIQATLRDPDLRARYGKSLILQKQSNSQTNTWKRDFLFGEEIRIIIQFGSHLPSQ